MNLTNALSVDLEDWHQLVEKNLTGRLGKTGGRLPAATGILLDLLREKKITATFFVLGVVADQSPNVVRSVVEAGHEIATHGYGHDPVWDLGERAFRLDLTRAVDSIEGITGTRPVGYRAPAFSLNRKMGWAFRVLAEQGFQYDSSLFPVMHRRYGDRRALRHPHWIGVNGSRIAEYPLATWRVGPVNLPAAGGGYLRLFPSAWIGRAIRQLNQAGHPAVLYLHPYEFDPEDLRLNVERLGRSIGSRVRRTERLQNLGRRGAADKLGELLDRHRFGPIRDLPLPKTTEKVDANAKGN